MGGMFGAPRIPRDCVHRPRLSGALDAAGALAVVHGPDGSGKTVAVADWASTASGVWFTVRHGSSSRFAFWNALAVQLTDAGAAPPDSVLGSGGLSALASAPDPRELLVRAFSTLPGQLRIVLDGFHRVTDPAVAEDLVALLEAVPQLSVVVVPRSAAAFASTTVRLSLEPTLIGPEQLHFTEAEIAELLASSGLADPEGAVASAVLEAVGGNPLLSRGIVQAMRRGDGGFGPESLAGTVSTLGSRLLRELLREGSATPERRMLVAQCSVPPVLTAALIEELTGREGRGADVLTAFDGEGFGVWSTVEGEQVFSFSPAVRSAFRAELDQHWPEQVPELSRVAAVWCSEHGLPGAALASAVAAGELELATDIVLRHMTVSPIAPFDELIAILNPLPIRRLTAHPILAATLALAHLASGPHHRVRALELFALTSTAARLQRDRVPPPKRAVLMLLESAGLRVIGRGKAAVAVAESARELAAGLTEDDRAALGEWLPMLLEQSGITFFYGGSTAAALGMFESALGHGGVERGPGRLHAMALIAGVQAIQGNVTDAAGMVSRIRERNWPSSQLDDYPGCFFHLAQAQLALEAGEFAVALERLEPMGPHFATIEHWPLLVRVEAMALLGLGEPRSALAAIESAVETHARVTTAVSRVHLVVTRALLHAAVGEAGAAEKLLRGHSSRKLPIAVGRARLELLRGRPEDAARLLLAVVPKPGDSVRWRTEALLLRAAAGLRLGRAAAVADANEGAALMSEHGLRMPLRLLPHRDVEALRAGVDVPGSLAARMLGEPGECVSLLPDAVSGVSLSERELVVLRALTSSEGVAEVAERLFVSKNTVKSQLRSIYRKLGVGTRSEALLRATELDLLG